MKNIGNLVSIYVGALIAGLAIISYPASAAYMVNTIGLTPEQYGNIYLPKIFLGILGALMSGSLVKRISLKSMWIMALGCFAVAQIMLVAALGQSVDTAAMLILVSSAVYGFGFGFGGGPHNAIAALSFPKRSESAVTMLHMFVGLGMTICPILFARAITGGYWSALPITLASLTGILMLITLFSNVPKQPVVDRESGSSPMKSFYFWIIVAIAVVYAVAEGTIVSWAVIYVQDTKGLSAETAGYALAAFMAMLTLGRFITSILLLRMKPVQLWLVLPPLLLTAFILFPMLQGDMPVLSGFVLAGLACSAFFPLMLIVCAEKYPNDMSYIASMLLATILAGGSAGGYVIGQLQANINMDDLFTYSAIYPVVVFLLILWSIQLGKSRVAGASARSSNSSSIIQ